MKPPLSDMMHTNESNPKYWLIPGIATVAFLSFFLDWINVHGLLNFINSSYSGLDLLQRGMESDDLVNVKISSVSLIAILVYPVSAIAVLLFFFNKRRMEMVFSMGCAILCALWILVRARAEIRLNTGGLVSFNYETGFILMELCALAFGILLIMKISKR